MTIEPIEKLKNAVIDNDLAEDALKIQTLEKLLELLQEECAEVIKACSKVKRFGTDGKHPRDPEAKTNITVLMQEIGDVLAIVDLLYIHKFINNEIIQYFIKQKLEKISENRYV